MDAAASRDGVGGGVVDGGDGWPQSAPRPGGEVTRLRETVHAGHQRESLAF